MPHKYLKFEAWFGRDFQCTIIIIQLKVIALISQKSQVSASCTHYCVHVFIPPIRKPVKPLSNQSDPDKKCYRCTWSIIFPSCRELWFCAWREKWSRTLSCLHLMSWDLDIFAIIAGFLLRSRKKLHSLKPSHIIMGCAHSDPVCAWFCFQLHSAVRAFPWGKWKKRAFCTLLQSLSVSCARKIPVLARSEWLTEAPDGSDSLS